MHEFTALFSGWRSMRELTPDRPARTEAPGFRIHHGSTIRPAASRPGFPHSRKDSSFRRRSPPTARSSGVLDSPDNPFVIKIRTGSLSHFVALTFLKVTLHLDYSSCSKLPNGYFRLLWTRPFWGRSGGVDIITNTSVCLPDDSLVFGASEILGAS